MKIHNLFDKVFRHKISQQNPFSEIFGHICGSKAFTYPNIFNEESASIDAKFTTNTNYTKSNNDYTVTKASGSGTWDNTRTNFAMSSGKHYWEIKINTAPTGNYTIMGVVESDTTGYPGSTANTYGYNGNNGTKFNSASSASYGAAFTTGDIIGTALDLDNGKIWWSKNGVWQASGDPGAGTGEAYSGIVGTFYAAIGFYYSGGGVASLLGQGDQVYTTPTGFTPYTT
ncbi:MAG: hypothetical protein KAR45_12995 [Desulfobacteraceae bacterium]|nr:hypothetical protein [Desulfobacteraceae bacterium]